MAAPIPTMTLTIAIPELAELVQVNRDLRDEIQNLRTELSRRLQAIETQLAKPNTNIAAPLQELVHDISPTHGSHLEHKDHVIQNNGHAHQDGHVRDDQEDARDDHVDDLAHDSSPSVDEGITVIHRVSPPPAAGRKRKRAVKPAVTQRTVEARPSRSESPFDSNDDIQDPSSDKLEIMPPVRPLSKQPRAQRPKTIITDEPILPEPEEITTSQYGRIRKPARPPPGFVSTPKDGELAKMLRQTKK